MLKTTTAFVLLASLISAAPTALDKPVTLPLSRKELKPAVTPEQEALRSEAHLLAKWPQLLHADAREEIKAKVKRDGVTGE